jgi:hypothetical protein
MQKLTLAMVGNRASRPDMKLFRGSVDELKTKLAIAETGQEVLSFNELDCGLINSRMLDVLEAFDSVTSPELPAYYLLLTVAKMGFDLKSACCEDNDISF